jgi:insertion element IS1 protein InsB
LARKAQWAVKVVENRKEELESHPVERISSDEMWTYVGARNGSKRKSTWIWTAILDKKKVVFEIGDRSEETFLRLCNRLPAATSYHTDTREVYRWLPYNQHHVEKFGKVNHNEAIHSILRDRLRRLARRTKGYSKSVEMLCGSLALVCLYMGWI